MADGIYSIDWIAHHAERSPDSIACVDAYSDRTFSYAGYDDRISRLANALRDQLGITEGARVLVLSRNDTDVFELQFACHRALALFVPLNWRLSAAELEAIARDAAPSIIFYGSEFRGVAEQVAHAACIDKSIEMRSGGAGEYEASLARSSSKRREVPHDRNDIWALRDRRRWQCVTVAFGGQTPTPIG